MRVQQSTSLARDYWTQTLDQPEAWMRYAADGVTPLATIEQLRGRDRLWRVRVVQRVGRSGSITYATDRAEAQRMVEAALQNVAGSG